MNLSSMVAAVVSSYGPPFRQIKLVAIEVVMTAVIFPSSFAVFVGCRSVVAIFPSAILAVCVLSRLCSLQSAL